MDIVDRRTRTGILGFILRAAAVGVNAGMLYCCPRRRAAVCFLSSAFLVTRSSTSSFVSCSDADIQNDAQNVDESCPGYVR